MNLSAMKKRRGKLEGGNLSAVLGGGNGADDETAGRAIESDGEEDHLVGGRRDHRGDGSDDAAMAGAAGKGRVFGPGGPAQRQAERSASPVGDGGTGAAAVPGDLLRSEHAALSGEARRRAWHPAELHVGAEGAARGRAGGARAKAPQAPAAKRASTDAGDAAAHRRQQAPMVRR